MTALYAYAYFQHIFYGLADLIWLLGTLKIVSMVSRSKYRIHLQWLVPCVIDNSIQVFYRTVINLHFFADVPYLGSLRMMQALLYIANFFGLYSLAMLYRTFKDLIAVNTANEPAATTIVASQEGVWPPPPTQ